MNYIDIDSAKIAYKIFGNETVKVVIEHGLNSCSAEWWHIGEILSKRYSVLVYDRAGYCNSTISKLKRTPKNIAYELEQLLTKLNVDEKVLLVGHSQGGLYLQQFVRLYPDRVKGLILSDPLSANDSKFKELLTEEEYKKSGVDKTKAIKVGSIITKCGLGFIFKPLLKKTPPFYYYNDFSEETYKYILTSLTQPSSYKTAYEEYVLSHNENETNELKCKHRFPNKPLTLITHSSEVLIKEIMYYGNASKELAEKVEEIWQKLMKEYLVFSTNSRFVQCEKSSHYIHLTEFEKLKNEIDNIMIS